MDIRPFFTAFIKGQNLYPRNQAQRKSIPPIASQNRFGQIFRATTPHPLNGIVSYDRSAAFSWLVLLR